MSDNDTFMQQDIFQRTALLLGDETMACLASRRVILFGVGGVGSWCAEALVRSGITRLTIVDGDCVCVSNINRQLMATTKTVGQPKVDVLRQRLLDINPSAQVNALQRVFCADTVDSFALSDYDYIVDAIDSLADKALLIRLACQTQAQLFSSMGAALKTDPTRVRVTEFWRVEGDPLARALRRRFKHDGCFPERKFQCVFSDELRSVAPHDASQPNGSIVSVTAVFGLMLASLVVRHAENITTKTIR